MGPRIQCFPSSAQSQVDGPPVSIRDIRSIVTGARMKTKTYEGPRSDGGRQEASLRIPSGDKVMKKVHWGWGHSPGRALAGLLQRWLGRDGWDRDRWIGLGTGKLQATAALWGLQEEM